MVFNETINQIKASGGISTEIIESLIGHFSKIENQARIKDDLLKSKDQEIKSRDQAIQSKDQELHYFNVKIAKLEFENKLLRHLKYGATNEALPAAIRDLFAETFESDVAAIEAEQQLEEVTPEKTTTVVKKIRSRAGRQALPEHCRVLMFTMSQRVAHVVLAATRWCVSVKMSAKSGMSNLLSFLYNAISVANTFVMIAKH
jgi:hypothetical protein